MADKFSIDDIISEYSEKVENDLKTDESQENDEILMRVLKKIMISAI